MARRWRWCCPNGVVVMAGDGDTAEPSPSSSSWRWDLAFQDAVRNVMKKFDDYMNSSKGGEVVSAEKEMCGDVSDEWDWERWKMHFTEVEEEERLVSVLKSQLAQAISREDYEHAARLKVAIAAAATKDIVGRVMSHLNKALEEERYRDAIFMRDYAGTGLVGWWAGTSEDVTDPYGRIVRISAEHGRYVARSYSPRGQGRLAEPGFRNPRWVNGELVILDGKYIKGGPVVGFVYWAPEYHFLVFFHRLRLQE